MNQTSVCFDTETTGLNPLNAELVGISFSWEAHKGFYVPFPEPFDEAQVLVELFRPFFESSAIEKIGTLPNLLKKSTKSSQKYLTDINHFLRDIYLRGYFITNHMKSDLNDSSSDGVIGSLYWFIARTNHEIINYEFVTIDKLGNLIKENNPQEGWLKDNFDGIKFLLKDSNKIQKELIYLSADISNRGLNGTFADPPR